MQPGSLGSRADEALGIYISIPFCRSKCTYCNFASGVYPTSEHARYMERLAGDLASAPAWATRMGVELPRSVDTVYLGGGTPSLLAPELVDRLFAALRAAFALDPDAEITVECAPAQIADATLDALCRAGVNRVSLGVQSFVDREARQSGRLHTRAAILDDLRRLRAAGIRNLSIDLIAGLPGQSFASWEESLAVLTEAGPPHASIYMLEVDEDSRLGREILSGGGRYRAGEVPGELEIVQMYGVAIERLREAGLEQYEISNFACPGAESRHNLRYWHRRPYLGLGLDASSMLRAAPGEHAEDVLRTTATSDLRAWLAGDAPLESVWHSRARQHEEAWFLGLRTIAGVDPGELGREFGPELVSAALAAAAVLVEEDLLERAGTRLRLTPRGRLLSNEVFERFLDLP
ncbi:MAG: radical SAM family heme chaperone HemW [Terracidiphilus sp.]